MNGITKKIILILICCFPFLCKAGEIYTLYDAQNELHYRISFDNEIYDISCTVWSDHQGISTSLSIGIVIQHQDTVIFLDVVNGYNIKAIHLNKESLVIVNGYKALNGKTLGYWAADKSLNHTKKIVHKEKEYFVKHSSLYDSLLYNFNMTCEREIANSTVDTGLYVDSHVTISDTVIFQNVKLEKTKYQYRFNNAVLSEGTWTVFKNYILFKDETLNAFFAAKIEGENSFTTITFPSAVPITLKVLDRK